MKSGPKILFLDIETAPILGYVWQLFDQNVALNQIHTDWSILSWSAKWLHSKEVLYMDVRGEKDLENDKKILKAMWSLLDEADIIVTQNGKKFDQKKLNARFIVHGFRPPSTYKHIDTLQIAKKHFGFTSNKLEYMASKLCTKYKKLAHKKFPGFELWRECLAGNVAAWDEMKRYNVRDTLVLEELYHKLMPWDGAAINFALYHPGEDHVCACGSKSFQRRGFHFTQTGKFQRFQCRDCGAWSRGRLNLISEESRSKLMVKPQ